MLLAEQDVEQGAQRAYASEVQKTREGGKMNQNPELNARVRAISEGLIPVTSVFRADAQAWKWESILLRPMSCLMARAGYDPQASVRVRQKMLSLENCGTAKFLSTHPSPPNRISQLEAAVPKVRPSCLAARQAKQWSRHRDRMKFGKS